MQGKGNSPLGLYIRVIEVEGMIIRPMTIGDVDRCERLEGSYTTEHVWQMEATVEAEQMSVSFRRFRLPRPMQVRYPRQKLDLLADCQQSECFLVADELGVIYGYLDMRVQRWQWRGWIEHLIIDPPYRRRGIATLLLQSAERWARGSELRGVVVALQPKNDPGIALLTGLGYRFCGFMDHYYHNGDTGLFYQLTL